MKQREEGQKRKETEERIVEREMILEGGKEVYKEQEKKLQRVGETGRDVGKEKKKGNWHEKQGRKYLANHFLPFFF